MTRLTATISTARIPGPERMFLLAVVLISGTVTLPQVVQVGFMSGLGLWTLACAGCAWALWAVRPRMPLNLGPVALPLGAFSIHALLSPVWGVRAESEWIQQLAVLLAFFGLIMLAAREVRDRPWFIESLMRALDWATITASVGYLLTCIAFGPGNDAEVGGRPLFMVRPFALFAMIAVARQLARFHAGEKSGMFWAIWMTAMVVLSHSRLAMVVIMLLYPLSFALIGGRKNLVIAALMLGLGALGLVALLTFSQQMYDRFFAYDASLEVGGVAINASGRTKAWQGMLADLQTPGRILFGNGIGSASVFVNERYENLPHPHNDYLRFLYDVGVIGAGCFVLFMVSATTLLWRRLKGAVYWANRDGRGVVVLPLCTMLSFFAVAASMATDNSCNYIYVMAPMGLLLGAALGTQYSPVPRAVRTEAAADDGLEWVFRADHRSLPLLPDSFWDRIEPADDQQPSHDRIADTRVRTHRPDSKESSTSL
jgi:hypothetical protein